MAKTDIPIRALRETDLEAFKSIRLEMLRACPESFGTDYSERAADPESEWVKMVEKFSKGEEGRVFLAGDGEPVAMLGVMRENGRKNRHAAFIWGVYVRPGSRGQKLTERMLREAIAWCAAVGVEVIRLTVVTGKVAAIRVYHRCGFQVCGVGPQAIKLDGVYFDELMMWRMTSLS